MASKYLLRRRNRFGQYAHLDTLAQAPDEDWIARRYGPGTYEIYRAEDGVVGQSKVAEINVSWQLDYVEVLNGQPTLEYIREKHGVGNYMVVTGGKATPFQVFPEGSAHDATWEMLQDGAPVITQSSIVFRVSMPWV